MKKLFIILLFIIPIITYPLIATKDIIKDDHSYKTVVGLRALIVLSGPLYVFIWIMKYAKIRTNILRTMLHKAIFSVFNFSLFPLVVLILKGKLRWGSEDLAYFIAFSGSIFELIFSPELRKIKGDKIHELFFEYFVVPLIPCFSGSLFALAYDEIISFTFSIFQKLFS